MIVEFLRAAMPMIAIGIVAAAVAAYYDSINKKDDGG